VSIVPCLPTCTPNTLAVAKQHARKLIPMHVLQSTCVWCRKKMHTLIASNFPVSLARIDHDYRFLHCVHVIYSMRMTSCSSFAVTLSWNDVECVRTTATVIDTGMNISIVADICQVPFRLIHYVIG
jgi:hypothetical protein